MNIFRQTAILCACVLPSFGFSQSDINRAKCHENWTDHICPILAYLKDWPMLGIWAHAGDDEVAELHTVYASPGAIEAYLESRTFADGTVILKELRFTKTEDMTTGRVSHASDLFGWFVMVKDSQNRFPDNPLWGDGWGWAYFDASDPSATLDGRLRGRMHQLPCSGRRDRLDLRLRLSGPQSIGCD